jgi:glucose-1-phosphate adenylyltransferase
LAHRPDTVLILPGDHVYKMDFRPLLGYHQDHQGDVTICAARGQLSNRSLWDSLVTDEKGRVTGLREKPPESPGLLTPMGIYVFKTDILVQCLSHAAQTYENANQGFGAELVPPMLELGARLYTYAFDGYWANVDTVPAYWKASMDLLRPSAPLDLSDRRWEIHTRSEERPPAIIHSGAVVSNSLVTDGCIVDGKVEYSVLFPGVRVDAGALVRYSIVFDDGEIGSGAVVSRSILDKNVVVGQNVRIGLERQVSPQRHEGTGAAADIIVVEKDTRLPPDCCVGSAQPLSNDLGDASLIFSDAVQCASG